MNLQSSEFIALTNLGNLQRIAAYNMIPGTVVRLRNRIFVLVDVTKGPHQWIHAKTGRYFSHEQFAARMRADYADTLPVILFDPLDTGTNPDTSTGTNPGTDTSTDTDTDKENNSDND